ncbi:MAG: imidazolonepropionase [Saprospiraceae bacterium]
MYNNSLLIKNIYKLIGILEKPYPIKKGKAMSFLNEMENAFLLIEDGKIISFGSMENCPQYAGDIVDATGSLVLPSWVDSHTHIVFPKSREHEFIDKIKGLTYEEIAQNGGGIVNSARMMNNVDKHQLYESAMQRLHEIINMGTGAVEIKSGYGLNFDNEIKMLRVIRKIKENSPIPVKANFLGAHALLPEYKSQREIYIDEICYKMIPYITDNGLADYIDVFCDTGFFTVDETDKILQQGAKYGLKAKIHANELAISGGVQVGVKNNAISVDHLERISDAEIECLANSNTVPTVLPGTSFFLKIPYAQGRKMIDSGLGIAVASDFNPGSSPSGNMNFIISLACIYMGLMPEEAINAATINAAHALELQDELGSISVGKTANLIITKKIDNIAQLPYYFGSNLVKKMVVGGKVW